jgi:hypothetical protein
MEAKQHLTPRAAMEEDECGMALSVAGPGRKEQLTMELQTIRSRK